jgi:uncharacterized protein (TIGR03435 family)
MRCLSILALLCAALPLAAQPAQNPPSFEVADIKPSDPSKASPGKGRILPGGRIELYGGTAKDLIKFAYGVVEDSMIVGAPKWAETERFDVVAKAPEGTPPAALRQMLQPLLAERFQLATHRDQKEMPAYVLTLGKRPLKLQPGSGKTECSWQRADAGLMRRECHNLSIDEFARQLPGLAFAGIDRTVIDQTGLKGGYDLQFVMMGMAGGKERERSADSPEAATSPSAESGPTIFEALEQIGLHLEARKMPVPVIVIDRIERPTAN